MIIKLENYNNFSKENKNYNDDIRPFIAELLETNSTGRIKYKISEIDNFYSSKRHHYFSQVQDKKEYLKPQKDENTKNYSKYPGLGPLEFSLASYLLNKHIEYNVLILTGALGSGKSCLCNYTLEYITTSKQKKGTPLFFPEDGLIHKINFNEYFNSNSKDELIVEFKLLMISKLTSLIEKIHKQDLFINRFIEKINAKDNERYDLFSEFIRKLSAENKATEELKFDYLLNWLNNFDHNLSYKLRLISYLLAFIKESKRNNGIVDFIILFDNIDKLNDDAQIEILNVIFSFSVKLPIKILVPMRLTTFGKIKGNGSYSFGVLQNTGQPPISIFAERIKHFINNKSDYNIEQKISKEYEAKLNDKVDFIANCLDDNTSLNRLTTFFTSISGNSIRRGLFLSERFFINSVIRYDDSNYFQDEFLKALLVSENDIGKFSNDDRLVNNIFSTSENTNTLLKLRILQILDFFRENNWICKINLLISQISLFEEYSNNEILDSINDLILFTRRLVYIEGVREYSDYNNLSQSMNDIIHITYSGIEYLNTLVYNTVYLQNSFITMNWKIPNSFKNLDYLKNYIEKIYEINQKEQILYLRNLVNTRKTTITDFISQNYDHRDIKERMKLLRECLYFLMLNDLNQIAIYYENNNIHSLDSVENRYIKTSIVIDIIAKTALNVLNILRTGLYNKSEIHYWYDFLLISDLWHTSIFKTENKLIEHSITVFKRELNLK